MTDALQPPARRFRWRRLFRFGLRTMIIFTTAVAIWLGVWLHKARQQREAVAKLEDVGAVVGYYNEKEDRYNDRFKEINHDGPKYWPAWLVEALGIDCFDDIFDVRFPGQRTFHASQITDEQLVHIGTLRRLRLLDLKGTRVTDVGLENLWGLTEVQFLRLEETRVTEHGISRLQKALPNCHIYHDRNLSPSSKWQSGWGSAW